MRRRHIHRHSARTVRVVYRPTRRTGIIGGCLSLGIVLLALGVVFGTVGIGACAGLIGAPSARHGRR